MICKSLLLFVFCAGLAYAQTQAGSGGATEEQQTMDIAKKLLGQQVAPWIGLKNYEALLQDNRFWAAVKNAFVFTGGSVAAFGLSASIFAMLLYLVLYLQDVLRFSALGTGTRLLVISGGTLVTSAVAGSPTIRPGRRAFSPDRGSIGNLTQSAIADRLRHRLRSRASARRQHQQLLA